MNINEGGRQRGLKITNIGHSNYYKEIIIRKEKKEKGFKMLSTVNPKLAGTVQWGMDKEGKMVLNKYLQEI